jgi:hypothetical protein
MHETLQEYLSRCLRISKSQADKGMDTKAFLKEKMREFFLKESNEGKDPIWSKEELIDANKKKMLLFAKKPISVEDLAPTENAASTAHNVSAGWGFSVTSKPPMKEIPTVRVITQPATAAAFTTQPLTTTQSC